MVGIDAVFIIFTCSALWRNTTVLILIRRSNNLIKNISTSFCTAVARKKFSLAILMNAAMFISVSTRLRALSPILTDVIKKPNRKPCAMSWLSFLARRVARVVKVRVSIKPRGMCLLITKPLVTSPTCRLVLRRITLLN